ncbi:hypothetical protein B0I35DRAFT_142517 [Stachybotrys elegans]|uniref:Uncharacterized protein n=1 Tax=Stachybotrys elegans TaxID=80388 RepID=A0A8K0WVI6_9HYPO|nr:hypothetical protein B0I35DRAFT_142517 [Stachybotrys elegans]
MYDSAEQHGQTGVSRVMVEIAPVSTNLFVSRGSGNRNFRWSWQTSRTHALAGAPSNQCRNEYRCSVKLSRVDCFGQRKCWCCLSQCSQLEAMDGWLAMDVLVRLLAVLLTRFPPPGPKIACVAPRASPPPPRSAAPSMRHHFQRKGLTVKEENWKEGWKEERDEGTIRRGRSTLRPPRHLLGVRYSRYLSRHPPPHPFHYYHHLVPWHTIDIHTAARGRRTGHLFSSRKHQLICSLPCSPQYCYFLATHTHTQTQEKRERERETDLLLGRRTHPYKSDRRPGQI